MSLRTITLTLFAMLSLSLTAQNSMPVPNSGSYSDGGYDLDTKMKIYLGLELSRDIPTDELVDMCKDKMGNMEFLDYNDTAFLLNSGILDYLFDEAQKETNLERKGKKIYRIKCLLEQNMKMSSSMNVGLIFQDYRKRLDKAEADYEIENDVVELDVLQEKLADHLKLPRTTPLDDLVEIELDRIYDNGSRMEFNDIRLLMVDKLFKYLMRTDHWSVDAVIVAAMLRYNAEVYHVGLAVTSYPLMTETINANSDLKQFVKGVNFERKDIQKLRENMVAARLRFRK